MNRIKNHSRFLATMLITLFLFISCVEKKVEKNDVGSIENTHNEEDKDPNNPLNIIGMKVEWQTGTGNYGTFYSGYKIALHTPDGYYKYSDEDAELYYDKYAIIFATAACICDTQLFIHVDDSVYNIIAVH